jgi:hypothetical protein
MLPFDREDLPDSVGIVYSAESTWYLSVSEGHVESMAAFIGFCNLQRRLKIAQKRMYGALLNFQELCGCTQSSSTG